MVHEPGVLHPAPQRRHSEVPGQQNDGGDPDLALQVGRHWSALIYFGIQMNPPLRLSTLPMPGNGKWTA